ncbi:MAG: hypothetical protein AAF652_11245 [Cyanobacteria bacterium P01_C01_bin.72]
MNKIIFLSILTLFACQSQTTSLQIEATKTAGNLQQVSRKQNVASEFLISPNGIGQAKIGMTLGQLKQIADRDTEFVLTPAFTSEYDAIAVTKQGLVQYYILFEIDSDSEPEQSEPSFQPTDDDIITLLLTSNYNYQTQEGIKVGTSIQEAEDIYGNAILTHNVDGQSGEYISFDDYNPPNVHFRASHSRLISNGLGFAGIYAEYPGVASTTDKYQADAAIAIIEVSCAKDICSES